MNKIYYAKPSITELEVQYATDAARNGWGDHCYDYIARFEKAFRDYLGVDYALATSSCTGALHLGLAALGIGPGDEVLIADINWVASVAPVVYVGAKPVFIDILPDTWCIDPEKARRAITSKTKAIIAVHLYGSLCEMEELQSLADEHGLSLIEDAAEALGSEYRNKRAGSMGTFATFSFHGTKTVTTGEGGMLVTNNRSVYEKGSQLNNHGRNPQNPKQFWAETIGFKYRMSNLQAAVGCAQIERVEELVARKREIFSQYQSRLSSLPGVRMNTEKPGTKNSYWMPTIMFDSKVQFDREILLRHFRDNNIDGRVFFYPLSSLPAFSPVRENVVSYETHLRAVNLPSYHDITSDDLDRVMTLIEQSIGQR